MVIKNGPRYSILKILAYFYTKIVVISVEEQFQSIEGDYQAYN
jgi:hypothetical protein